MRFEPDKEVRGRTARKAGHHDHSKETQHLTKYIHLELSAYTFFETWIGLGLACSAGDHPLPASLGCPCFESKDDVQTGRGCSDDHFVPGTVPGSSTAGRGLLAYLMLFALWAGKVGSIIVLWKMAIQRDFQLEATGHQGMKEREEVLRTTIWGMEAAIGEEAREAMGSHYKGTAIGNRMEKMMAEQQLTAQKSDLERM